MSDYASVLDSLEQTKIRAQSAVIVAGALIEDIKVAGEKFWEELSAKRPVGVDDWIECEKTPAPVDQIINTVSRGGFVLVVVGKKINQGATMRVLSSTRAKFVVCSFNPRGRDGKFATLTNPARDIVAVKTYSEGGA